MPNIQSAKKRVRQAAKRTARNRVRKERLKKVIKSFTVSLESGDAGAINTELSKAYKAIDKASTKGILHKQTASRKKSRLAAAAKKATA